MELTPETQNKDGTLSREQLIKLFSTTPGCPWEDSLPPRTEDDNESMSKQAFMSMWR